MTVLITSGGTAERIDAVRRITNTSTGRLGALIAERFARSGAKVFYVHAPTAASPRAKAQLFAVESVADLDKTVREVCANNCIEAVIHAMAVGDYQVKSVFAGENELPRDIKISSDIPELTVKLTRSPKIIALFQTIAPNSILVGFKLTSGVSETELFSAARELMSKNKCAFVLANDSRDISGDRHVGHLLSDGGEVTRFETKNEIAEGILGAVNFRRNGQYRGV